MEWRATQQQRQQQQQTTAADYTAQEQMQRQTDALQRHGVLCSEDTEEEFKPWAGLQVNKH